MKNESLLLPLVLLKDKTIMPTMAYPIATEFSWSDEAIGFPPVKQLIIFNSS